MLDVAATEFLVIPDLLKAMPSEEAGRRLLYFEASNEAQDYQGEVVLTRALAESAGYYLQYGNVDLDHITQTGPVTGLPNYHEFEIGRPVDVKIDGARTLVKAEVYQGEGRVADAANSYWASLHTRPPQRWYPSVGGKVLDAGPEIDPQTRQSRRVIRRVRWTNIGLSKTPVNLNVPHVSTVPFGALRKSWDARGLDLLKALTAGYGTDSATLNGGAALRTESLDRGIQSYWDFRDRMAGDVRARKCPLDARLMVEHAHKTYGISKADAAEWGVRFIADLRAGKNKGTH